MVPTASASEGSCGRPTVGYIPHRNARSVVALTPGLLSISSVEVVYREVTTGAARKLPKLVIHAMCIRYSS